MQSKEKGKCEHFGGIDVCVGQKVRVVLSWRPAVIIEGEVVGVTKTTLVIHEGREIHMILWREVRMLTLILD